MGGVAEYIIELIEQKANGSNRQFAKLTGISESIVGKIANGLTKPNYQSIQKLLVAFPEIDVYRLMSVEDSIPDGIKEKNPQKVLYDTMDKIGDSIKQQIVKEVVFKLYTHKN